MKKTLVVVVVVRKLVVEMYEGRCLEKDGLGGCRRRGMNTESIKDSIIMPI